jgi:nicotinamide N-methyltransferase
VATDYPDQELVDNLRFNCSNYDKISVLGYLWGKDVSPLLSLNDGQLFDVAILSDLVFNHVCHRQLLTSVVDCLKRDGIAIVTFSHHRPAFIKQDLKFFKFARKEFGLQVKELGTEQHEPVFEDDLGSPEVRGAVHIWMMNH